MSFRELGTGIINNDDDDGSLNIIPNSHLDPVDEKVINRINIGSGPGEDRKEDGLLLMVKESSSDLIDHSSVGSLYMVMPETETELEPSSALSDERVVLLEEYACGFMSKRKYHEGGLIVDGKLGRNKRKKTTKEEEEEDQRRSSEERHVLYSRKRREKINQKLKTLQSLVPNSRKVDIGTMLEQAILYVKFLQLQIKCLSSDDISLPIPFAFNEMLIGLEPQKPIPYFI